MFTSPSIIIIISLVALVALVALNTNASPLSLQKRRFNQENPPVLQEVRKLNELAKLTDGRFDTISGTFINTLLAAADACARYKLIDEVVTICKANNCAKEGIEVAAKLAAAEKNFNPFSGEKAKPAFCDDASLPASPEVRCVIPIIDPAVAGAAEFNQKVQARLQDVISGRGPQCSGQSVKAQAIALGVSDCVGCTKTGSNPTGSSTPVSESPPAQNTPGTNNSGNPGSTSGSSNGGKPKCRKKSPSSLTSGGSNPQSTGGFTPASTGGSNPTINNVNLFKETLLGAKPVVVNDLGEATQRRFDVLNEDGSSNGDFLNKKGALQRACSNQKNKCAQAANSSGGKKDGVSVSDCEAMANKCQQANGI